jgi:hypothetical protein
MPSSSPSAATATACARNSAVDFCRRALRHKQPAPSPHDHQGVSSSCRLDAIPHDAGTLCTCQAAVGSARPGSNVPASPVKITAPQAVVSTDKWRLG